MCPYLWRFIPCFIFLINFCLVIYLKDTQFNIFCVSQFSVHFRTQCHSFIKPCLKAFPRLRLRMFWFIVWLPACSGRFTWNISFGKNMFLLYFSTLLLKLEIVDSTITNLRYIDFGFSGKNYWYICVPFLISS